MSCTQNKNRFLNLPSDPTGVSLVVSSGPDAIPANATQVQNIVFGDALHFWSSGDQIQFAITAGSAVVQAQINPAILAGLAHTVVTGIDLKINTAGDALQAFISWTDADGVAHTEVDSTEIPLTAFKSAQTIDIECYEGPGVAQVLATNGGGAGDVDILKSSWTLDWTNSGTTDAIVSGIKVVAKSTGAGISGLQIQESITGVANNSTFQVVAAAYAEYEHNFQAPVTVPAGATITFTAVGSNDIRLAESSFTFLAAFSPASAVAEILGAADPAMFNLITDSDGVQTAYNKNTKAEVDITAGIPATWLPCSEEPVEDPASTELGNLMIVGDDGEEYSLPLKQEDCYQEAGAPAALAGVNMVDSTGDLDDDDLYDASLENTTSSPATVSSVELTLGAWVPAATITLNIGGETATAAVPAAADGQTFTFIFPSPVVIAAGATVSGYISSSEGANFSGDAQLVATATALAAGASTIHTVRTYSDGETEKVIEHDDTATGGIIEYTAANPIPADWTPCGPLDDEEIAAIQAMLDAKPDLFTKCIDCYNNAIGFDFAPPQTGGSIQAMPLTMTFTPTEDITTQSLIIEVNDIGTKATPFAAFLDISEDGVLVASRESFGIGGQFTNADFGFYEFKVGVVYQFAISSDYDQAGVTSHQTSFPVVFDTPAQVNTYPAVQILENGEDVYKHVTLSDGSTITYDQDDEVVVFENTWIPCLVAANTSELTLKETACYNENLLGAAVNTPSNFNTTWAATGSNAAGAALGVNIAVLGSGSTSFDEEGMIQTFPTVAGQEYQVGIEYQWNNNSNQLSVTVQDDASTTVATGLTDNTVASGAPSTDTFVGGEVLSFTGTGADFSIEVMTVNGGNSTVFSLSILPVGTLEHEVQTYSDGTNTEYRYFDALGGLQIVSAVPVSWFTCPAEEQVEYTCPAYGEVVTNETLLTTRPTNGEPGTLVPPVTSLTLTNNVVPVQFYGFNGALIDAEMTVEVVSAGGGNVTLNTDGLFVTSAANGDYTIEIALADGLAFEWMLHSGSNSNTEALVFLADNPAVEYAQGTGGISITLPYVGSWHNNNNGNTSGFGFASANTAKWRTNGVNGASSNHTIALRQVPLLPAETLCKRTQTLADLISQLLAAQ